MPRLNVTYEQEVAAVEEGRKAFRDATPLSSNPHAIDDPLHDNWRYGWLIGAADSKYRRSSYANR